METTIHISPNELTPAWLKKVKALFENENELQITIKPLKKSDLVVNESSEEYMTKVNRAIDNIESGEDVVSLSAVEFDKLADQLLNKK
jgi:anthranilate/para-aminobenzoate synthase component I